VFWVTVELSANNSSYLFKCLSRRNFHAAKVQKNEWKMENVE
jgi:hypothetical protein